MPDSDNEKSAAIDKVVGAFRARREQAKDDPAPSDATSPAAEDAESTKSESADQSDSPSASADEPVGNGEAEATEESERAEPSGSEATGTDRTDRAAEQKTPSGPTPVVKLGDQSDDAPQPKGGGSDAPTKAFKVPPQVAAAAAAAQGPSGSDAAASDDGESSEEQRTDTASDTTDGPNGLVEEVVVGEATTDDADTAGVGEGADADAVSKAGVVEESVALSAPSTDAESEEAVTDDDAADDDEQAAVTAGETPADEAAADDTSADEGAAAAAENDEPAADEDAEQSDGRDSEQKTEKIAVPAAAAAAAGAATTKIAKPRPNDDEARRSAGDSPSTPQPNQPAAAARPAAPASPQVIEPKAPPAKSRGKLWAVLIAAIVVLAAVAVGLWYLLVGSSPESKVADAATTYQEAMVDGDLSALRDITCGEENAYYTSMSDADFAEIHQSQKNRNELMEFDDVNAVAIDGDTARVGVDMYKSDDPGEKIPAQITLHKIGEDWKVCKQP